MEARKAETAQRNAEEKERKKIAAQQTRRENKMHEAWRVHLELKLFTSYGAKQRAEAEYVWDQRCAFAAGPPLTQSLP